MTTPAEIQTRKRIKVLVAAYAYEFLARPVMSDTEFDELAASIDLSVGTGRPDLDIWFILNFQPFTGQWIWKFPELQRVGEIYERFYKT